MKEVNDALGSIGVLPGHFIRLPPIPTIVSEWASLLPLVVHLASSNDDYTTVGDISLLGQFPVSLFPPLGTFLSMSRLLRKGTEYLDFASSKGGSSQMVWDVKHGSVFPVVNGSASASITSVLAKMQNPDIQKCYGNVTPPRRQILNVYNFQKKTRDERKAFSWGQIHDQQRDSRIWQGLLVVFLVLLCALFTILGAYGTAAISLLCAVSRAVAQSVTFIRPENYLRSNTDYIACMLVAAHPNALEWNLFIGDRGIVDNLLNKPMIEIPHRKWIVIASRLFWLAHFVQLFAMTFAAGNKGWDGVFLVALLALHYMIGWRFSRSTLVTNWLKQWDVTATVRKLEFSGRQPMLGTIQVLSKTAVVSWMDSILVPHPKRDVTLEEVRSPGSRTRILAGRNPATLTNDEESGLNEAMYVEQAKNMAIETKVFECFEIEAKSAARNYSVELDSGSGS